MKKYKAEFKLEVVQSFMAGEGGAKLLAWRWSLPEEKIRTWVSHYRLHGVYGLAEHGLKLGPMNVFSAGLVQEDFVQLKPLKLTSFVLVDARYPDISDFLAHGRGLRLLRHRWSLHH